MKIYFCALIASLVLLGCSDNHVYINETIDFSDLQFPDPEKEYLLNNKVDTMVFMTKEESLKLFSFDDRADTFKYRIYDLLGRLVEEEEIGFGGYRMHLQYDSLNFLKHKVYFTDFAAVFAPTYNYVKDSLLLYQYWTGNGIDTSIFRFDRQGKLIESEEYSHNDFGSGRFYKSQYFYNSKNQLTKKIAITPIVDMDYFIEYEKDWGELTSTAYITNYHYSENKLDSTITYFYYPSDRSYYHTEKTYYNEKGLRVNTIIKDSLEIRYAYSFK